jgi:hypothetical protein
MRHREREARSRDSRASNSSKTREGDKKGDSKDKDPKDPSKRRRKPRGMDLIDQLDQTGIYGAGCKLGQISEIPLSPGLRHDSYAHWLLDEDCSLPFPELDVPPP